MNRTGHRGVALGTGSVVALGLLYFELVPRTVSWACLLLASILVGTLAASAPDRLETFLEVDHRQETHTVWFALGLGLTVGALLFAVARQFNAQVARHLAAVPTIPATLLWVWASGLVVTACALHLFVDMASASGGFVVRPLLGLSDGFVALGLYTVDDEWVDAGALVVGWVLFGVLVAVGSDWVLFGGRTTGVVGQRAAWLVSALL